MLTVKQAKIDELDIIVKFYSDLIDSMSNAEFKPAWIMGVYPTEQLFRDAINEQTLYLAYLDNSLVGALILNHNCEPEYENIKWQINAKKDEVIIIHLLGVSASYHRKGVGKQIVASVIEMCKKNQSKAIRLDVLKPNIPAAKLYLSMGFKYIDSIKMYYEDTGWTDFLLYELIL